MPTSPITSRNSTPPTQTQNSSNKQQAANNIEENSVYFQTNQQTPNVKNPGSLFFQEPAEVTNCIFKFVIKNIKDSSYKEIESLALVNKSWRNYLKKQLEDNTTLDSIIMAKKAAYNEAEQLAKKKEIDTLDEKGDTPLVNAIKENNLALVIELIKQGANIEKANKGGFRPLHIAARDNYPEIAKFLCKNNIQIDATCQNSEVTALHLAAWRGNLDIVKLLLENGADINKKNKDGNTALFMTALKNCPEIAKIAKFLVNNQADYNIRNKSGQTALDWAIKNKRTEIAELLSQKMSPTDNKADLL